MQWFNLADSAKLPAVCGLYIIRGPEGKEYVGKSINVQKRMEGHRQAKQEAGHLHRAIRKHGLMAFSVCLLRTGTEEEVTAWEIEEIEARGTFGNGGYNATRGGDGSSGTVWTTEMRARKSNVIREVWTDERRAEVSARFKGKPLSEETKEKMRQTRAVNGNPMQGRKHSPEALAKISAANKGRVTVITPETRMKMAAAKTGTKNKPHTELTKLRMSLAKRGVPKPEGFAESRKGAGNPMYGVRGADCHKAKIVAAWPPESMLPLMFDTADAAAAYFGCRPGSISDWCSGRYKPKNGHVFAHT